MEKHYETVFISNPVLSDKQIKETVKKVEDFIIQKGGNIVYKENWGLKKLAYTIQRKKSGFYSLVEFNMNGEHIKDLDVLFKRDETIMRHLIVAMDKHAIEFSGKTRGKRNHVSSKEEEKEVVKLES